MSGLFSCHYESGRYNIYMNKKIFLLFLILLAVPAYASTLDLSKLTPEQKQEYFAAAKICDNTYDTEVSHVTCIGRPDAVECARLANIQNQKAYDNRAACYQGETDKLSAKMSSQNTDSCFVKCVADKNGKVPNPAGDCAALVQDPSYCAALTTISNPPVPISFANFGSDKWADWIKAWSFSQAAKCQQGIQSLNTANNQAEYKAKEDECKKTIGDQANAFQKQQEFFSIISRVLGDDNNQAQPVGENFKLPSALGAKIQSVEGRAERLKDQSVEANWNTGPAQLNPGDTIGNGDKITVGNGKLTLEYPGGYTVTIEGNTDVTVSKTGNGVNVVYADKGTLLVVRRGGITGKDFIVGTPNAAAVPEGTTFLVSYDQAAGGTKVAVVEGSVKVTPTNGIATVATVSANQEVAINSGQVGPTVPISAESLQLLAPSPAPTGISSTYIAVGVLGLFALAWLGLKIFKRK